MRMQYFQQTDTLEITFGEASIAETRPLDEDTQLALDSEGRICGITMAHAATRADIPHLSFEQISELEGRAPSRSGIRILCSRTSTTCVSMQPESSACGTFQPAVIGETAETRPGRRGRGARGPHAA